MAKSDVTSEMKVDLQALQQPQPARASVPDPNMDGPPKVGNVFDPNPKLILAGCAKH